MCSDVSVSKEKGAKMLIHSCLFWKNKETNFSHFVVIRQRMEQVLRFFSVCHAILVNVCTCETAVKVYTVPSVIITAGMFDSLKQCMNIAARIKSDLFPYLLTQNMFRSFPWLQNSEFLSSTELCFMQQWTTFFSTIFCTPVLKSKQRLMESLTLLEEYVYSIRSECSVILVSVLQKT
jgi:hypothetical protein